MACFFFLCELYSIFDVYGAAFGRHFLARTSLARFGSPRRFDFVELFFFTAGRTVARPTSILSPSNYALTKSLESIARLVCVETRVDTSPAFRVIVVSIPLGSFSCFSQEA